jgi:acyl dehydratase
MPARTIQFGDLKSLVGQEIGVSEWLEVTQERVNEFADATEDHQWIHCDPERAKNESPFGGPIAHGYLTLSLLPHLMGQVWHIDGVMMGINYGVNKVRFPSPVPVGSKVRARVTLDSVDDIRGGVQCVATAVVEIDGQQKPACAAETVVRLLGAA